MTGTRSFMVTDPFLNSINFSFKRSISSYVPHIDPPNRKSHFFLTAICSLFMLSFKQNLPFITCVCVRLHVCTRSVSEHKYIHNRLQLELTTPQQTVVELVFEKRWQRAACQEHRIIIRLNASMSLPQANTCHSCGLLTVYMLKTDKK